MDELRDLALGLAEGQAATASALERVGKATSPDAARWAFAQWELRKRAKAKFARADAMLFVREALEQATHERVAAYHAFLFPTGALVADLTVGIGADLIALAARGPALGFELDPERAEYARHNLAVHGLNAEVRVSDSLRWLSGEPDVRYAFADPARRVEGRRTLRLDEFAPDPSALAEGLRRLDLGVMKLSPMLNDDTLRGLTDSLRFVSFRDECREVLAQFGSQAEQGVQSVHVESGETLDSSILPAAVETPGGFLYDADPAAIRAHALGTLCARYGLSPLGDSNGYLTGDTLAETPWLRPYRVLYHGKADAKTTKKALRDLDAATPELKQRQAGLDLIKERKQYAMEGKRPVSLAIWLVGRSARHTILEAA